MGGAVRARMPALRNASPIQSIGAAWSDSNAVRFSFSAL